MRHAAGRAWRPAVATLVLVTLAGCAATSTDPERDLRDLGAGSSESSGSAAEKTALPATNTSAPASAQRSIVSRETPPSTWSQVSTPCLSISARARRIFGRHRSRNFWPPKPGSTVMMSLEATGVNGLIPVFEDASDAEKAALA